MKPPTAKRGRPASFDRAEAVERAMELFWARGYEGVTLEDLQAAMGGISPPSFYNAFGSKEELFKEATALYISRFGHRNVRAMQEAKTAREAVGTMLRLSAEAVSLPGKPRGCMVVLGAMNCTPSNQAPQEYLRAIRQGAPKLIKQRLDRAVAEGEFSPSLDTRAIASFYATVINGLAVSAGDGASRAALLAAADGAMAAWKELTAEWKSKSRRRSSQA
jgi:AcrR family transcriptional regulator